MAAQQAKNLFNRLSRVNYSEFQNPDSTTSDRTPLYQEQEEEDFGPPLGDNNSNTTNYSK